MNGITFRKKIYSSLAELQIDVDEWLRKYNIHRPHSGKYCYGKNPMQTFLDAKSLAQEKWIDNIMLQSDSFEQSNLAVS